MINKMTKSRDRNTISDLAKVCPKQDQDFLSCLFSSKTVLPGLILSFVQSSVSKAQFLKMNASEKITSS